MKSGPLGRGRRITVWAMAQSRSRSVCVLVTVFISWAITVSKIIKNLATDFETFPTYIAGYDRKVVWSLIPGYLLISQFIALFLYYFAKNTLAPSRLFTYPTDLQRCLLYLETSLFICYRNSDFMRSLGRGEQPCRRMRFDGFCQEVTLSIYSSQMHEVGHEIFLPQSCSLWQTDIATDKWRKEVCTVSCFVIISGEQKIRLLVLN